MAKDFDFDQFVEDIAPDVMAVLERQNFFSQLETEIYPTGKMEESRCIHDFSVSLRLLTNLGHDKDAQEDVLSVLRSKGGFCDCEAVLNAAPESEVRKAYWMAEHAKLQIKSS
ncbi:DUF2695 domain-containing protein [Terriglobus tenax]|uniref:DUF2695 domain-containing protein n=1 Tax=Terriglobus tenax TaxID=1111115 RepID=UPI0021DF50FB|nr:DUF2695 domain-containing protein [Terriglobus tenax]